MITDKNLKICHYTLIFHVTGVDLYSKNSLIRNQILEISLFCFLYNGAISRNRLKCFLNQYIRNFLWNIFCSCFQLFCNLYSISPLSRHNRQSSHHFVHRLHLCPAVTKIQATPPHRIMINNLHFRETEVVMR